MKNVFLLRRCNISIVYFSSDWHIGHKNIHKFRCKNNGFFRDFKNESDHRGWLFGYVNENVRKRDVLYLLGDIAFDEESLIAVSKLPGRKILTKGNHDLIKHPLENKIYDQVLGLGRYKRQWISHAPIHPDELRGRLNYHGHCHNESIRKPFNPIRDVTQQLDNRYFNCCVENLMKVFGKPVVEYSLIKQYMEEQQ